MIKRAKTGPPLSRRVCLRGPLAVEPRSIVNTAHCATQNCPLDARRFLARLVRIEHQIRLREAWIRPLISGELIAGWQYVERTGDRMTRTVGRGQSGGRYIWDYERAGQILTDIIGRTSVSSSGYRKFRVADVISTLQNPWSLFALESLATFPYPA